MAPGPGPGGADSQGKSCPTGPRAPPVTRLPASSSQFKHPFPPKYSRKGRQHFQKQIPLGLSHFHAVFSCADLLVSRPRVYGGPSISFTGQRLPTAPTALLNGKVRSYGQDTQKSLAAGGGLLQQFPRSSRRPRPPPERQGRGRPCPRPPGVRGLPQDPLLSPKVLQSSSPGPNWRDWRMETLARMSSGLRETSGSLYTGRCGSSSPARDVHPLNPAYNLRCPLRPSPRTHTRTHTHKAIFSF